MNNCCIKFNCIQCCVNTNMILSNKDIERIGKLGFTKSYFVKKHKGWFELKNKDGSCIFHNGKSCSIYPNRPEGCRLYPIVYDTDNGCAMIDNECPHKNDFTLSKKKNMQLLSLIKILEYERSQINITEFL